MSRKWQVFPVAWLVVLLFVSVASAEQGFLYFREGEDASGSERTLARAQPDGEFWVSESLISRPGLTYGQSLPNGHYLFTDQTYSVCLSYFDKSGTFWLGESKEDRGVRLVSVSPDGKHLVFSFPDPKGGFELREYIFGDGWQYLPLAHLDRFAWVSPGRTRYAYFAERESGRSPVASDSDLYVGDLPSGKPRLLVGTVHAESTGSSVWAGGPTLLWVDDDRILYQETVPTSDPAIGEADSHGQRHQQTLCLINVVTGEKLLTLAAPGLLGRRQHLWREWPGGQIHYRAGEEYLVDLEQKKLTPAADVAPLYVKRVRKEFAYSRVLLRDRAADKTVVSFPFEISLLCSPDGRYAAFVGSTEDSHQSLWVYDRVTGQLSCIASGRFELVRWLP